MNYKVLLLSIGLVASPIICEPSDEQAPQWKKYLTEQAVGITSGAVIGAADALGCSIGEGLIKKVAKIDVGIEYDEDMQEMDVHKSSIFVWPFSAATRHAVVHRAAHDMQKKHIPVNEGAMHVSSWLSSWVCYYLFHRY